MISIPPKGLQNALIFYFTCIIIVTSGFFAIVTISRENLTNYEEAVQESYFLGRLLVDPARILLTTGSKDSIQRIWESRTGDLLQIKATVYDEGWWPKWGDTPRNPSDGFPTKEELRTVSFRPGVANQSSREIFFAVASQGVLLGAVAVGVPMIGATLKRDSVTTIVFSMIFNILMGIALAMFIAQIILRPLNDLLEGLETVKRGDLGQKISVAAGGELQVVGEMFNLMTASLGEKTREALERTRVLDEKVQELWEIYGLTKEMGFSLHLHQILKRFLEKAQTLSFSSYAQILLFNPGANRFEVQAETPVLPLITIEEYEKNLQACLKNIETTEGFTRNHTLLFLPLVSGRVVKGVLFLAKQGSQQYSEGIRRFLETIAPLGGSLIENAQLYQHVVGMKDYIRNVLESVDSGVATVDVNGMLVSTNSSFRKILGLAGEVIEPRSFRDVLMDSCDPAFVEKISTLLNGNSPANLIQQGLGQLSLNHPGRDSVILQIRVHPLRAGENIIGKVLILDDLTSLKQIERRMLESEKWAVLGRLAASVAHEIRNPLVSIRSLAEVLGEDLSGEQLQHIRVVIGEVDRLNKVVEQLLNLARPEATNLRRANLIDILEEILLLIRHEAHRHKVDLQRVWFPNPVYVKIDTEKMKQAFLNVMLNAIQSMDQGGTLTVRVREATEHDIFQKPVQKNEVVVVEFEDEGHGITPEDLARVFEPFFTTKTHGTGLGLAITKKVIDLHDGQIVLDSKLGQGTKVTMAIPSLERNG